MMIFIDVHMSISVTTTYVPISEKAYVRRIICSNGHMNHRTYVRVVIWTIEHM